MSIGESRAEVYGSVPLTSSESSIKMYQGPQALARYKLGSTTFDGTPLTLVVKLNRPNCLDVLRLLLEAMAWIQRENELVFT